MYLKERPGGARVPFNMTVTVKTTAVERTLDKYFRSGNIHDSHCLDECG